jgi:hypothetical protein
MSDPKPTAEHSHLYLDHILRFPVRVPIHDPVDLASYDVHSAVADFMIEILQATTVNRALKIRERLKGLVLELEACESAALEKADKLCG